MPLRTRWMRYITRIDCDTWTAILARRFVYGRVWRALPRADEGAITTTDHRTERVRAPR